MARFLWVLFLFLWTLCGSALAQPADSVMAGRGPFTRADSLRGREDAPYRSNYDVRHYDLQVAIDFADSSITGQNTIRFEALRAIDTVQIDLFAQLQIDSILGPQGNRLGFRRVHNAVFAGFPKTLQAEKTHDMTVYYHGQPREAVRAPWDGGFVWARDAQDRPWVAVACEGLGASSWWPLKDHLSDEPDSMRMRFTAPKELTCISNGTPVRRREHNGRATTTWKVQYPINSYNVTFYLGHYAHLHDSLRGAKGLLPLDYYVLDYNKQAAQRHFRQVKPMLRCYERYLGPYPFYQDGYALVEAPYWGMEHQSAVAYGNEYQNNSYGFDFIIVHETGHEWYGNHWGTADHGELWIHEALTTYAEAIYLECRENYETAETYLRSRLKHIKNEDAILGPRGVNFDDWEASDMYYKGAWMFHSLRHAINNDSLWWATIRGLYDHFAFREVCTPEVVAYFNETLDRDVTPLFDQYLRYPEPPQLAYQLTQVAPSRYELRLRWAADVPGFSLPVYVRLPGQRGLQRIEVGETGNALRFQAAEQPKPDELLDRGKGYYLLDKSSEF